jgi:glycine cleavage system aminomethyltransferase T
MTAMGTERNNLDDPATALEVGLARTKALEPDFVGLDRAEAELLARHLNLELRIIDADDLARLADLRSNRMTLDLRTGVVTEAVAG